MRWERKQPSDIPPYLVPLSVQVMEIVQFMLGQLKPALRYLFSYTWNLKKRMGYTDQLTDRSRYSGDAFDRAE